MGVNDPKSPEVMRELDETKPKASLRTRFFHFLKQEDILNGDLPGSIFVSILKHVFIDPLFTSARKGHACL